MEEIRRGDPRYPERLLDAHPPPAALYVRGDPGLLRSDPSVAVIGSRKMTPYGKECVRRIVPGLARRGLTIVSGLAYGIDGEAHRLAAAEGGKCLAVLGCGADRIYPPSNRAVAEAVLRCGGAIVSEYPPGTPPYAGQFPARNRIIASLATVVLVIEAAERSGTAITARQANEMGRDVCVVPADITREGSAGTLRLLKDGARPVSCAEDVVAQLSFPQLRLADAPMRPALTGSPAAVYACALRGAAGSLEGLAAETGFNPSDLAPVLSVLELDGYLIRTASGWQPTS